MNTYYLEVNASILWMVKISQSNELFTAYVTLVAFTSMDGTDMKVGATLLTKVLVAVVSYMVFTSVSGPYMTFKIPHLIKVLPTYRTYMEFTSVDAINMQSEARTCNETFITFRAVVKLNTLMSTCYMKVKILKCSELFTACVTHIACTSMSGPYHIQHL